SHLKSRLAVKWPSTLDSSAEGSFISSRPSGLVGRGCCSTTNDMTPNQHGHLSQVLSTRMFLCMIASPLGFTSPRSDILKSRLATARQRVYSNSAPEAFRRKYGKAGLCSSPGGYDETLDACSIVLAQCFALRSTP